MRPSVLASTIGLFALAGCGGLGSASGERTLTVNGPTADVEHFVQTQTARHPGLSAAVTETGAGRSQATLDIPATITSVELAETSKQAIAARLSVKLET